ncbi:MAG: LytTR family DNA-binding domain-containing protein [Bacteroidota bacterium]
MACFENAITAIDFLNKHKVDLIFLDIEMDELSGIELLKNITFEGAIIITSAYDQYALQGYELSVTDYLLKPFTLERFIKSVDKVLKQQKSIEQVEYIFIKTENRLEKIALDQILFIEGMRDYRRIHCLDKKLMTLETFGELERLIPPEQLCRVHKSYMVALNKIDSVEKNRIKIGDTLIPLSATYKTRFFQLIKP